MRAGEPGDGLEPPGWALHIVHAALLAGHSALFVTAVQMLLDLGAQESARALDRRLLRQETAPNRALESWDLGS